MPVNVIANFEDDYAAHLRQELTGMGVKAPEGPDLLELARVFWNARRRRIEPRPRKVHFAAEFQQPTDPLIAQGLVNLVAKFERGDDVNPHLSRGATDPEHPAFDDKLLNDWGIHHFHLGAVTTPGTGRTSLLAFARVSEDAAYIIDVRDHHSWSSQDLMVRVHANWPHLLHKAEGFSPSAQPLTDAQIGTLRKRGMQAFFQAPDGNVYFPPGGGFARSGISVDVVRAADWSLDTVRWWDKYVKENPDSVADDIAKSGRPVPTSIALKLEVDGLTLYALEATARVRLKLGPLFPR